MGWYRERILPWAIDRAMSRSFVGEQRAPVLAQASGRVLEIGFGTGASLAGYPGSTIDRIVGLEPNVGMWERARRKAHSAGIAIELVDGRAESMPFPDASFDTVVSNFTLCSIQTVDRALSEVRRVLTPEGRFLFLEHGLSEDPRVVRWQRRLTPFHRWYADGCRLDLAVEEVVRSSGLEITRLERYVPRPMFRPFLEMYRGIARPGRTVARP